MLLVSVQNLQEAEQAIDADVDLVDFKDPRRGPLAATDPAIWRVAAARWGETSRASESMGLADVLQSGGSDQTPTGRERGGSSDRLPCGGTSPECRSFGGLSAALGEFPEGVALATQVPPAFRFAKIGPSGRRTADALAELWAQTVLPSGVTLVPVSYADHRAAETVTPELVLDTVIATGRNRLLIDTFGKAGRRLTDHLPPARLCRLVRRAQAAGVWVVLAGSINLDARAALIAAGCEADCWGVRGDVCHPASELGRAAPLDESRLYRWRRATRPALTAAPPVIANRPTSDTLGTR